MAVQPVALAQTAWQATKVVVAPQKPGRVMELYDMQFTPAALEVHVRDKLGVEV
jgi:hypothetical protein